MHSVHVFKPRIYMCTWLKPFLTLLYFWNSKLQRRLNKNNIHSWLINYMHLDSLHASEITSIFFFFIAYEKRSAVDQQFWRNFDTIRFFQHDHKGTCTNGKWIVEQWSVCFAKIDGIINNMILILLNLNIFVYCNT